MIRDMRLRKERERRVRAEPAHRATAGGAAPPWHGAERMKLVDTDETVVLVTGSSLTAEERDRPLAYLLKAEIDRRGDGPRLPARRRGGRSSGISRTGIFHLNPTDRHRRTGGERRGPGVLGDPAHRVQPGRDGVRAGGFRGRPETGGAVGGERGAARRAAVEVFATQGLLDDLLRRIWRFRTSVMV